jgi:moderate conductance mechanosensitive channel
VSDAAVREACGDDPGWVCRVALDVGASSGLANALDVILGKPLTILVILVAATIANRFARRSIKRGLTRLNTGGLQERAVLAMRDTQEMSLRAAQRVEALSTVLRSVVAVVIWVIATLLVLGELGVQIGPLLAGAGVVGVAIGFGSQALVRDFLSGVFILVEDQFGVGDVVDVGEAEGVVEAVSLRTTRVRSVDGVLWHVPNGEIRRVGNKSQHWSRALLDIQVAYGTDIPHASDVIKRVADAVWEERDDVIAEPEIWGVEALGANGIDIRLVVKTRPSAQWAVAREVRERIAAAFAEEGIEIPFPQQTVWYRGDGPARAGAAAEGE